MAILYKYWEMFSVLLADGVVNSDLTSRIQVVVLRLFVCLLYHWSNVSLNTDSTDV